MSLGTKKAVITKKIKQIAQVLVQIMRIAFLREEASAMIPAMRGAKAEPIDSMKHWVALAVERISGSVIS